MSQLPAGPSSVLVATYKFIFDPVRSLRDWVERYGYVFTAANLMGPQVYIGEPELVRELFAARDPELFAASTAPTADVIVGRESLLVRNGQPHSRDRKLLSPAFHGERMRVHARTIVDATHQAIGANAVGEQFDALERAQSIALDIIVRVVFGAEGQQAEELYAAVEAMMGTFSPGFLFTRQLQRSMFGMSAYARFIAASDRVDELIYRQIATARATPEGQSILHIMLEARYDDGTTLSDQWIRDQLRTLLVGGHETTATTIAWALYFLGCNPDIITALRPLVAAAEQPDDYTRIPLLVAVLNETMRLRPISQAYFRRLCKPWHFAGMDLDAGVTLCPSPLILHFRPDLWPDPERFDPQRFVGTRVNPTHFIPFGGGVRRCIGAAFANYEGAVVLGAILRNYEFELLDRDVTYGRDRVTLGPVGGVPMRRTG